VTYRRRGTGRGDQRLPLRLDDDPEPELTRPVSSGPIRRYGTNVSARPADSVVMYADLIGSLDARTSIGMSTGGSELVASTLQSGQSVVLAECSDHVASTRESATLNRR
jgi:hypothetical protein